MPGPFYIHEHQGTDSSLHALLHRKWYYFFSSITCVKIK